MSYLYIGLLLTILCNILINTAYNSGTDLHKEDIMVITPLTLFETVAKNIINYNPSIRQSAQNNHANFGTLHRFIKKYKQSDVSQLTVDICRLFIIFLLYLI